MHGPLVLIILGLYRILGPCSTFYHLLHFVLGNSALHRVQHPAPPWHCEFSQKLFFYDQYPPHKLTGNTESGIDNGFQGDTNINGSMFGLWHSWFYTNIWNFKRINVYIIWVGQSATSQKCCFDSKWPEICWSEVFKFDSKQLAVHWVRSPNLILNNQQ